MPLEKQECVPKPWPVGVKEIAARLGVSDTTVTTWRYRSKDWVRKPPFPDPTGTISNVPWWWWDDIEQWARDSGRQHLLPTEPAST